MRFCEYAFEVSIIEEGDKQRPRRTTWCPVLVLTSGRRCVRAQVSLQSLRLSPMCSSADVSWYSVFSQSTALPFWAKEKEPKVEADALGYSGTYGSAKYTDVITKPITTSLHAVTKHLYVEGFNFFLPEEGGHANTHNVRNGGSFVEKQNCNSACNKIFSSLYTKSFESMTVNLREVENFHNFGTCWFEHQKKRLVRIHGYARK